MKISYGPWYPPMEPLLLLPAIPICIKMMKITHLVLLVMLCRPNKLSVAFVFFGELVVAL